MKKSTKVRIAISAMVLIAAVALGIALDGVLTGVHTEMWQRVVFIVGIVGTGLGAVLCMIFGWKGFLYSYIPLTLLMIPVLLPKPWNGVFAALAYGALFVYKAVEKGKENKLRQEELSVQEPELTEEEQQLMEKLRPMVLVTNVWNGRHYQLFCREKTLTAYYIGSDFKGNDETLLQTEQDALRQPGEMDIVIPFDTIRSVSVRELPNIIREQAVLKTSGGKYRFSLMATDEDSSLIGLMQGIAPGKVKVKRLNAKAQEDDSEDSAGQPDTGRIKLFGVLKICFGVYLGLVNLPWMFIDVPYKLFSLLSIAAMPVLLIAYICFPGELTVQEDKGCSSKVSIMSLMVFSAMLPGLRSMLDFNITETGRVFLLGAAVFAGLIGVLLLLTKEWRKRKSAILILAFFLLFYAPAAVVQLNFDLDNSRPAVQQAVLIEKHVSHSTKAPDSYYIRLRLLNGETLRIRTGREKYSTYSEGDQVAVYTFAGAFDIPYIYAD